MVENDKGATASEIAKAISSNRMTVTKYLEMMKVQDLVDYRGVGMAKLWKINPSPILNSFDNGENELLKNAMNILGEGLCIIDRDMRIVWYNEVLERYIGKLEKNKGKCVYDFYALKGPKDRTSAGIKTFSTGEVCKVVSPIRLPNGKTAYFEMVTTPIKDKKGNIIAIMVLAVSLDDYRRKMDELRALMGK